MHASRLTVQQRCVLAEETQAVGACRPQIRCLPRCGGSFGPGEAREGDRAKSKRSERLSLLQNRRVETVSRATARSFHMVETVHQSAFCEDAVPIEASKAVLRDGLLDAEDIGTLTTVHYWYLQSGRLHPHV